MEELLNAVSTVGFPIAIACYMIYDKTVTQKSQIKAQEEMTGVLTELKILINTLVK